MKENLKVALLGVIALTLIVDTFFMDDRPARRDYNASESIATSPSVTTNTGNVNDLNPINPMSPTPTNEPAPAAPVLSCLLYTSPSPRDRG